MNPHYFQLATTADITTILHLMPIYYNFDHLNFDKTKAHQALTALFSSSENGRLWLLMDTTEKQAIGYLTLTFGFSIEYGGKVALIDELFVQENHRGKGIGSAAIQNAKEECKKLGINTLRLEVTKSNQSINSLYRKLGFMDLGRSLLIYHQT